MTSRTSAPSALPLSHAELIRYSRHLVLPAFGVEGQERLKAGRVLIVGAGGLGSPAALYLAAAGVGTLGLVDWDVVDRSNLQRQVLHGTEMVGRAKLDSARARIADLNPHVHLETISARLTSANALEILTGWDVVLDGSDNFPTRYLVNDACVLLDVREPFEWEIAHLAGARHIPLGQLPARLSELEGHADIVVYCHHGTRSARAVEFLRAAGYSKVRNLTGGIDAWATQVDAETPRY